MKDTQIATQLDTALSEFGNAALEEIKGEVKSKVNEQIQKVADKVQKKFVDKIGDDILRDASTKTLKKVASVDGLIGAFRSIQGNAGLLKETLGEAGRDIEKFLGGQMDRADLMVSLANRAEKYISDTFTKMVTAVAAAEFGPLATKIGEFGGYIAANLFREAVAPFINAAQRAKMAREKYFELHEIYENAIKQMQIQRENFERATAELFAHRKDLIDKCFAELDAAISVENVNKASRAFDTMSKEFTGGKGLKFQSQDEFDDFILNSNEELIL